MPRLESLHLRPSTSTLCLLVDLLLSGEQIKPLALGLQLRDLERPVDGAVASERRHIILRRRRRRRRRRRAHRRKTCIVHALEEAAAGEKLGAANAGGSVGVHAELAVPVSPALLSRIVRWRRLRRVRSAVAKRGRHEPIASKRRRGLQLERAATKRRRC